MWIWLYIILWSICDIQGQWGDQISIRKKSRNYLPDSAIDNGHDRELDSVDIGSDAKNKTLMYE